MRTCKRKTCGEPVEPPGLVYCAYHRDVIRRRRGRYNFRASGTAKARAYIARHESARRAATEAWVARHPERRALSTRLGNAIAAGLVKKPSACESCGRATKLVAWKLDASLRPAAFYCWRCWWRRHKAEG
jgi:hypothetical protein